MKEIKAIIDPSFIYHVMEALHALPRFPGVTISDANCEKTQDALAFLHQHNLMNGVSL